MIGRESRSASGIDPFLVRAVPIERQSGQQIAVVVIVVAVGTAFDDVVRYGSIPGGLSFRMIDVKRSVGFGIDGFFPSGGQFVILLDSGRASVPRLLLLLIVIVPSIGYFPLRYPRVFIGVECSACGGVGRFDPAVVLHCCSCIVQRF